jgi:hypothetical protein
MVADREMYYNISIIPVNTSNTSNISQCTSLKNEVMTESCGLLVASPPLLTEHSQALEGNVIAEDEFGWIVAQWAWSKSRARQDKATRLRVTMTFQQRDEIGTRSRPKKITFNLTDRLREFQGANLFQEQIKTWAVLNQSRWIGKARLRQPKNYEGALPDHYRLNIPDLVMTAQIVSGVIQAELHTMNQTIVLTFDQPLTELQKQVYDGEARWGRRIKVRPRDEFYDWRRYA